MVETSWHPCQQEPASLNPSAPVWTFPTNSLSTTQAKCLFFFPAGPKDFGYNVWGSREWLTYSVMSLLGPAGAGLGTRLQIVLFPEHVELR